MSKISGDTKLFGLLGHGARFTLSPAMHNHAAKILHRDVVYVNFDLKAESVSSFLDLFWQMGGIGLNVTMPHKSLVASLVNSNGLSSVNTLVRTEQGWDGFSTDGQGFLNGLARAGANIEEFDAVIILGSGGSTQAILGAITDALKEKPIVTVIHRRSGKNDADLRRAISKTPVQMLTLREMTASAFIDTLQNLAGLRKLVIQATSAPKHGDRLESYAKAVKMLEAKDLLVDIIYDDPSELYMECIRQGLNCLDGLPMLIEQARLSQHLWWRKAANYEDLLFAIKNSGWRAR
jgi:shikimate dehydrogenase